MSEGKTFTWLGVAAILGWLGIAALVWFLWGCAAPQKNERVIYRLTINGKLIEERLEEFITERPTTNPDPLEKDKPCE